MQPSTILIILGSTMLYLVFGLGHTNTLRRKQSAFRKITDLHPVIYTGALLTWFAIFIAYLIYLSIEPLTKSRREDWPENKIED